MHSYKCIHLQKDDAEIYRETFFLEEIHMGLI